MRRLVQIALIVLGIRAFLRWRKGREAQATAAEPVAQRAAGDPADELRRKLAESRENDPTAEAPAPVASVADRRAEVHEQGRTALDEMKPSDEG
jgi:hypothetical protein